MNIYASMFPNSFFKIYHEYDISSGEIRPDFK